MGILKKQGDVEVTFSFKPEDISKLIAKDLGVAEKDIRVRFVIQEVGGDPMDRFPGTNQVTKIEVTHKGPMPEVEYKPSHS